MEKFHISRILPGFAALVTMIALLTAAVWSAKPVPDDPEPEILPPLTDNPYEAGDFAYNEQGYLTCLTGESVLGIDVSEHQGEIDWQQVRAAGVEFVIIRVGGRGYGTGKIFSDSRAAEYYAGAKAAGLKVGAYFFSQAVDIWEAAEEARFLLQAVRDWEIDMPLVFDWEYVSADARTGNMDAQTLTECARVFCRALERAGYTPMVYFNLYQARDLMVMEELTDKQWWLARYADTMDFAYRVDMWQYSCTGTVPGISGEVDLNLWFPER